MGTVWRVWAKRAFGGFVWILVLLQALSMVDAGWGKFQSLDGWMHWFGVFGYPRWFAPVVGVLEMIGGVLLLVPSLSAYAAAMLLVIMAGALHAVTTHTTDLSALDPLVHGAMQAIILAARWPRRRRFGSSTDELP